MSDGADLPAPDMTEPDAGPRGDIVAGLVILAISLVGWWTVLTNPALVGTDYGADPGPGMLPQLTLTLLTVFSLVLAGRAYFRLKREGKAPAIPSGVRIPPLHAMSIPVLMVVTLVAYVLLFPEIGFIWATLGFALVWTVLLGIIEFPPTTMGSLALYVAEGGAITFLVWLAFAKLIGLPLP